MRIFLEIPGLDGDLLTPGTNSFELADYSFSVSQGEITNLLSAVGISLDALSPEILGLMRAANNGSLFKEITLRVMAESDGNLIEVERLTLEGAKVALVTSETGLASQGALSYQAITIKSFGFKNDGTRDPKADSEVRYDTGPAVDGELQNLFEQPFSGNFQPFGAIDEPAGLFAKIEGLKGDSVSEKFKEQFELSGAEVDLQRLVSAADSTSGRLAPVSLDFANSAPGLKDLLAKLNGGNAATVELTFALREVGGDLSTLLSVKMSNSLVTAVERLDGNQTRVTLVFDSVEITAPNPSGGVIAPIVASGLLDRFETTADGERPDNGLDYDTDTQGFSDNDLSFRLELFDGAFSGRPADDRLNDAADPAGLLAAGFEFDVARGFNVSPEGDVDTPKLTTEGFIIDLPRTSALGPDGQSFWADVGTEIGNLRFVMRDALGKVTGYFDLTGAFVAGYAQQDGFADRMVLGFDKLEEFKADRPSGGTLAFVSVGVLGSGGNAQFEFDLEFDPTNVVPQRPDDSVETTGFFFVSSVDGTSTADGFKKGFTADSYSFSAKPLPLPEGARPGDPPDIALSDFALNFDSDHPDAAILRRFAAGTQFGDATFFLTAVVDGSTEVTSAWKFTSLVLTSIIDGSGTIRLAFQFSSAQIVTQGLAGADKGFAFPVPNGDILTVGDAPGGGSIGFGDETLTRPGGDGSGAGEIRLQIAGLEGGASDNDLMAPFDVLAYYYNEDDGSPGTGIDVSSLVVDFTPGQSGLAGLLEALASGQPLGLGQLYDYKPGINPDSGENRPDDRHEIDLQGMTVLSYSETAQGSIRVVFVPSFMTLRSFAEDKDGDFTEVIREIDFGSGSVQLIGHNAPPPAAFERPTDAFLDFKQDKVKGDSQVSGFTGQYDVLDYALDLSKAETVGADLKVTLNNAGPGLTRILQHTKNGEGFPTLVLSIAAQGADGLVVYQIVTLRNVVLSQVSRNAETTTITLLSSVTEIAMATLDEDGSVVIPARVAALDDLPPGFTGVTLDAGTNDVVVGSSGNDQIFGGDGDDDLDGGVGFDVILGGAGNDTLRATGLAKSFDGGDGIDTIDLSDFDTDIGLDINLLSGRVDLAGAPRSLAFVDIDNAVGSRANDTITGSFSDNVIEGGAGADVMDGGEGNNTLSYKGSSAGVLIDLETQTAQLGDAEGDSFTNFSRVEGSAHNDSLTGDDNDNRLFGGAGDDVLTGNSGFDLMFGGDGNDRLVAGIDEGDFVGNEIYRGGAGFDTMVFFGNAGFINGVNHATFSEIERLEFSTAVHGGGGRFTFTWTQFSSVEVIRAGGRAAGNPNRIEIDILADGLSPVNLESLLIGGFSKFDRIAISGKFGLENDITGSSGRDLIFGSNLKDRLLGGGGKDKLSGSDGRDRILGGEGNDNILGGRGNDALLGAEGDDKVKGGNGSDTVGGGLGLDVLSGNGGADTFRFFLLETMSGDTITDFGIGGVEFLDFRDSGAAGFGSFDGTAGMLRFVTSGGNGRLEADADGNGEADFTLTLLGVTTLDINSLIF